MMNCRLWTTVFCGRNSLSFYAFYMEVVKGQDNFKVKVSSRPKVKVRSRSSQGQRSRKFQGQRSSQFKSMVKVSSRSVVKVTPRSRLFQGQSSWSFQGQSHLKFKVMTSWYSVATQVTSFWHQNLNHGLSRFALLGRIHPTTRFFIAHAEWDIRHMTW